MAKTKTEATAAEPIAAKTGPSDVELAAQRAGHKARLLALLKSGYTVPGLRMNDPKDLERGCVLAFDQVEQGKLSAFLVELVEGRS